METSVDFTVLDWLVIEPLGEWMPCLLSVMKQTEACTLNHLSYPWHPSLYHPCPSHSLVLPSSKGSRTGELFYFSLQILKLYLVIWLQVILRQHCIKMNHCPEDLDWRKQQKRREGHACSINTPLSVNVNLGLTVRKLEFKELQWGVESCCFFWNPNHFSFSNNIGNLFTHKQLIQCNALRITQSAHLVKSLAGDFCWG